uniref:Uncharacterized protein n=1 Tax=Myoviridae sp. ctk6V34 TaxID=2825164 RepID=A0A8S5V3X0_9CAUD|nr:MAG TPA: hypothetical protein [Myoviridae sp. ctk6V34]
MVILYQKIYTLSIPFENIFYFFLAFFVHGSRSFPALN